MNKLLFLLAALFIIPIVSADNPQSTFTFKQLQSVDLKVPCFNNGTYCSTASICNVTVFNPDNTLVVNNERMTNNRAFHNFSLSKNRTINLGEYQAIVTCRDGSYDGSSIFKFLITPSGLDANNSSLFALLISTFVLSCGLIIFGYNKKEPWLIIFGGIALFIASLYTFLNGIGNYRNTLTQALGSVMIGVAAYVSIMSALEVMNEE